jgi:hypothetical protein
MDDSDLVRNNGFKNDDVKATSAKITMTELISFKIANMERGMIS